MSPSITHYYIYFIKEGKIVFERTTGTEERAKERCEELRKFHDDAIYTVNRVIKGAYV